MPFGVVAISYSLALAFVLVACFQVRSSYRAGELFVQNLVRCKKETLASTAS